ncbi:MAG: gloA [Phycisphaerales bacterium]|nr:gloA [Phycisphaerales bacterium]
MPTIDGIIETALYVADLTRAARFYQGLFGFRTLLSDDRLHALSVADRHVLLLFARGGSTRPNPAPTGGLIPPHDGSGQIHIGFAIAADELEQWAERLREHHVTIESQIKGPRGGTSLYFRDPDGHLVELLTPGIWTIY